LNSGSGELRGAVGELEVGLKILGECLIVGLLSLGLSVIAAKLVATSRQLPTVGLRQT
jgi:hypothetical protein